MRDKVEKMLDELGELAAELGADVDEDGMIDPAALESSDDPQLAALGRAGTALFDLYESLPEDEPEDEPEEPAEPEGDAEAMPPEE